MINGQKEIWFKVPTKANDSRRIIALSNCGRAMRKNGEIFVTSYTTKIKFNNKSHHVYRVILSFFKKPSEDDIMRQRINVDHITHTPKDMYINDVRNLRWCTQKENCNFNEAIYNLSNKKKTTTEFGALFLEKYGKPSENKKLYNRLHKHYKKYGVLL